MVAGQRRDRVGGVDRDDDVGEDEAPARAQRAGHPGEEGGLVRSFQVVHGQRGDHEVEGARGQGVGQLGHDQLDGQPGQPDPGHLEHRRAPVDADGPRPGVPGQHGGQGLARARPEVEHPRHRRSPAGGGDRLLQTVVGGHLLAHQMEVGGRVEMELAHMTSRRSQAQRST